MNEHIGLLATQDGCTALDSHIWNRMLLTAVTPMLASMHIRPPRLATWWEVVRRGLTTFPCLVFGYRHRIQNIIRYCLHGWRFWAHDATTVKSEKDPEKNSEILNEFVLAVIGIGKQMSTKSSNDSLNGFKLPGILAPDGLAWSRCGPAL